MYKHGNQAMYRIGLVNKLGEQAVKGLETIATKVKVYKWSRTELNELIQKYGEGK
jgi:hypothetical protein